MADPKTLDLKDPQILRHYPGDLGGFFWHHRVLLEKCGPGIWIGLTPDGDLERIDLNVTAHITLDRKADFPPAQAPYVYAFDEMTRGELDGFRRRAKIMNNLFNDAEVQAVDSTTWVIADLSHPRFGEKLRDDDMDGAIVSRDVGIAEIEGEDVFVRELPTTDVADWVASKEKTKGDLRLLGSFVDGSGSRFLSFHSSVDLLRGNEMKDWSLSGPRAFMEYMKAVRSGANDLIVYHLNWVKSSGISQFAAAVHEHRVLCDSLKAFLQVDQVDGSNLLGCEILVRRLIQIETATVRNPQSPDYSGLDLIMEQPIGAGGEASVLKFSEWLGSRLKEKAQVQKQARLYREEFSRRRGTGSDETGGEKGGAKGGGRGNYRPKSKAKGAAAPAGAAANA